MSNKILKTRIINKCDIKTNWDKAVNFIPFSGELTVYSPEEGINSVSKIKVGDGVNKVGELPFATQSIAEINENIVGDPNKTYITTKGVSYRLDVKDLLGLDIGDIIDWGDGYSTIVDEQTGPTTHVYKDGIDIHLISFNGLKYVGPGGLSNNAISIIFPNVSTFSSISYGVFQNFNQLTSITIPNSVTSIGAYAFSGCTGLTSIAMPDSVTSIADHAFSGCSGFASVEIPNSVTSIGDGAFLDCENLKEVIFDATNVPTTIGSNIFPDTIKKIVVPKESIDEYKAVLANYADKIVYEVDSSDLSGEAGVVHLYQHILRGNLYRADDGDYNVYYGMSYYSFSSDATGPLTTDTIKTFLRKVGAAKTSSRSDAADLKHVLYPITTATDGYSQMNVIGVAYNETNATFYFMDARSLQLEKAGGMSFTEEQIIDMGEVPASIIASVVEGGVVNLKDGSGTSSLNQVQDGTTGTFDFTNKNPNATELDSTLTGQLTYGGTGAFSTAFGGKSQASGKRSFAAGTTTVAKGNYSAAFGDNSVALGNDSFVEGYQNVAKGTASHAAGESTQAIGDFSHASGYQTIANGAYSKAEGYQTKANASHSHAEGYKTITEAEGSHAEGSESTAKGQFSHAEGISTEAQGYGSHTEGQHTIIRNSLPSGSGGGSGDTPPIDPSTYTGDNNNIGLSAHNEGWGNITYGVASHAEGKTNIVYGHKSHAEGLNNKTGDISDGEIIEGEAAHAEGYLTHAKANYSHAEGHGSQTLGEAAHAGGINGYASGKASFAHGNSTKSRGDNSVAFGLNTIANADNSAAFGHYNVYSADILFSVGNGAGDNSRKNAFVVYDNGSVVIPNALETYTNGKVQVIAAPTEPKDVVRKLELDEKQDELVSGANIKTINGDSLLGSGDLVVGGGDVTAAGNNFFTGSNLFSQSVSVGASDDAVSYGSPSSGITVQRSSTDTINLQFPTSSGRIATTTDISNAFTYVDGVLTINI